MEDKGYIFKGYAEVGLKQFQTNSFVINEHHYRRNQDDESRSLKRRKKNCMKQSSFFTFSFTYNHFRPSSNPETLQKSQSEHGPKDEYTKRFVFERSDMWSHYDV